MYTFDLKIKFYIFHFSGSTEGQSQPQGVVVFWRNSELFDNFSRNQLFNNELLKQSMLKYGWTNQNPINERCVPENKGLNWSHSQRTKMSTDHKQQRYILICLPYIYLIIRFLISNNRFEFMPWEAEQASFLTPSTVLT